MCGIVGAVAERDIGAILIAGLHALEYRGYDSAGLAVLEQGQLQRRRAKGKVRDLEQLLAEQPVAARIGIAHTRWATHGVPSTHNAHPHVSADRVSVVHNGIIENHAELRAELQAAGYVFTSETDTEVIAHLVESLLKQGQDLRAAVVTATQRLHGAYAIAVLSSDEPGRLIGARRGSPLVVGIGIGEHFLGSDVQALLRVTNRFVYLQEGDIVEIRRDGYAVFDASGIAVEREERVTDLSARSEERRVGKEG